MDIRLPEEIWLAGKGPSLDIFDWSKAGPCRIGINETAFVIPRCWGAIAKDYHIIEKYLEHGMKDIYVFIKDTWPEQYHKFPKIINWSRPKHATILFGTSVTSVQVFHSFGAKIFHFVGFDSIDKIEGYASQIKAVDGEGKNQDNYVEINKRLLQVIELRKVTPIWEHRSL